MRSRYLVFAVFVLFAVLAVGAIGTIVFYQPPLPDPEVADRDDLLRWLVVGDLGTESAETRQVLARRLEEEFRAGLDWDAVRGRLNRSQRKRLWDNILLLLEPWFMEKTDGYFALDAAQRASYLDRVLETIAVWRGVDALRARETGTGGTPGPRGGLLGALVAQVEEWKQRASPQGRERINQFLLAVQTRWLLRNLPRFSPAPD